MNIGEISKPSVDGAQIDKKLKVKQTDPVLETQATSDLVELSEESQKRYQQESKKSKTLSTKVANQDELEQEQKLEKPSIDYRA